jgi:uncharacterized membrane protein
MAMLVLGLLLFLGVHSVRVFADGWRTATIARIGAVPWKAVYSVVSIATFVLIVWGYGQARQQMPLWDPPGFMRHVTALLMLPVFVMFVAAYVPKNAIKAKLGHPQILSVKLLALSHLLSNGNAADVLLFGGFLAWAIFDYRAARQRGSGKGGEVSGAMTAVTVGVGLAVYLAFVFGLHAMLIGVKPV